MIAKVEKAWKKNVFMNESDPEKGYRATCIEFPDAVYQK